MYISQRTNCLSQQLELHAVLRATIEHGANNILTCLAHLAEMLWRLPVLQWRNSPKLILLIDCNNKQTSRLDACCG